MRNRLIGVLFTVVFSTIGGVAKADLWIGGHGDIGVALDGSSLHLHLHLDQVGTRWDPVLGRVPNAIPAQEYEAGDHIIAVPNTAIASAFTSSFLGVTIGTPIYRLSSTSSDTAPYVGLASEELDETVISPPATISGPLTWSLLGATGPGNAAVWVNESILASSLNQSLSASGNNTWTTTVGNHNHFNFDFTAEGTYELTLGVSALVDLDGPGGLAASLLSDSAVFTFQTGPFVTAVPEPTSIALLGSVVGLVVVKRLRSRRKSPVAPSTEA